MKEKKKTSWIRYVNRFILFLLFVFLIHYLFLAPFKMFFPGLYVDEEEAAITFTVLGDSYVKGENVRTEENWPNVLTHQLKQEGIDVHLAANPAESSWRTQHLIRYEIPVYREAHADVVGIQIGVNDAIQGVNETVYRENIQKIFESVNESSVFVLGIPDFTLSPQGRKLENMTYYLERLEWFNHILKDETGDYEYLFVDILTLSRELGNDSSYFAADGFHPSAEAYEAWVNYMYDNVSLLVKNSTSETVS